MGYDSSGLLDLEGEGKPDLFLVAAMSLMIFLIADLGFTGFRTGGLGLIVTSFLFTITLISYIALSENVILSDGHILDGALGFIAGVTVLNIGNILAQIELSFLSSATTSYLAGILGSGQDTVVPIVNIIFAPIGETFLIFGLTAGIWLLVKQTEYRDLEPWKLTLVLGIIPSIIFGGLHGARSFGFLFMAFAINMVWTAIIVYSDKGSISSKWVPGGLGLVAGLHVGFNSSNFGGIFKFLGVMFDALGTQYGRSALAILVFFGLMTVAGLYRLYLVFDEKGGFDIL